MSQDSADTPERPLLPPGADAESGMLGWIVAAVAVLVLIVGAYHAYGWLVSDISQRRAVAEGTVPDPAAETAAPQPPGEAAVQPPPATGEPAAPAVTGVGVNKCVRDGHVTYTNGPCPEGSEPVALAAAGIDPNRVTGAHGDAVPAAPVRPTVLGSGSDPAQLEASCRYLAAEIERLGFEFRQPLPPPVLDHISTQLVVLRAQSQAADCPPVAKVEEAQATARPAKRAPRKMVDEKAGD